MSKENFDEYLNSELQPKEAKEKIVDYKALTRFIKSKFPISKTGYVLNLVECWKNLPKYQTEYNQYVRKLSNDDLNMLLEGINASLVQK